MDDLQQVAQQIQSDWGIELPNLISEEAIIDKLAERVAQLLQNGPDAFFQLMYRLDVPERKLRSITPGADVAIYVAKLIYDRQLQKAHSRAHFRNNPLSHTDDDDLKW
jgi:hypothetical protein